MKAVLEFFQFCFQFFLDRLFVMKVTWYENLNYIHHVFRIRLLDGCKLAINTKKAMTQNFWT